MKRLALALTLASLTAAALLALPVSAKSPGSDPGGLGLFREHYSSCDGTGFHFDGPVTLVRGGGTSFWADGHHLVIQSFRVADGDENGRTGPWSDPYTFGTKAGLGSGLTVTCTGYFPPTGDLDGYWVQSTDVLVP